MIDPTTLERIPPQEPRFAPLTAAAIDAPEGELALTLTCRCGQEQFLLTMRPDRLYRCPLCARRWRIMFTLYEDTTNADALTAYQAAHPPDPAKVAAAQARAGRFRAHFALRWADQIRQALIHE